MAQHETAIETVEIESDLTFRDIRRLGFELKVSPERAVSLAIEEKLARLRADERVREGVAEKLADLGREMSRIIAKDGRGLSIDLYDDRGLPK